MIERLKRNDVLLHAAIVFGGVVVSNVFNYLYYMLIGRRAGVIVYGEVTALASALLVLGAPANVAQLIVARITATCSANDDAGAIRRLAGQVRTASLAVGAAVVLLALVFAGPIARFFNLADGAPVIAAAVGLAAFIPAYVQRGVLQGAHLFEHYAASVAIEAVVKVCAGVALVGPFGAAGALAGIALGLFSAVVYNEILVVRAFPRGRPGLRLDRRLLAQVVGGVGVGQLTITVLTFYDVPLVKHAFDARSAGLYAAAALVGRAVIGACAFVPTIVLPKATARSAVGRSSGRLLLSAVGIALGFIGIAALASALAPRFVVTTIAGRSFGAAAPLVLCYVLASGALSMANIIASYNFGLHRYSFVVPAFVIALAEITTLALWHPTLWQVVLTLTAGHSCVLAATVYGIDTRARTTVGARDSLPEPAA